MLDRSGLLPREAAEYGAGWDAHLEALGGTGESAPTSSRDDRFAAALERYTEQLAALSG